MKVMAPHARVRTAPFCAMAALAVVATGIAGCDDPHRRMPDHTAVHLNDVTMRHPISFDAQGETLHIETPPNGRGLSRNQYVDVYRFAKRFQGESTGTLTLTTAHGGMGPVLRDVREALLEAGVDDAKVRRGSHKTTRRSTAGLRLTYARPTAIAPQCGHWGRDIGREKERVPYPEFGCATQRNLAGMVANARDLQRPQDEQPPSAERRSAVWSKYIAPESRDASGGADTKVKPLETTKKQ